MSATGTARTSQVTANEIVAEDLIVDHMTAHGAVRALNLAQLRVAGGTSVAVMGPSGSGKSTLLGLLAGLALPTSGTIAIGEDTISSLSERERVRFRRRRLGMVYQADNLLPHLSVEENLALQLAICRRDATAGQRSDPAAVLARLGMSTFATRLPDQLSGGQRQRVAVARAIIHRPAVILADEPTGALDEVNAAGVIDLLIEVHRDIGATLVIVTHDPQIADRMAGVVHLGQFSPAFAQRNVG